MPRKERARRIDRQARERGTAHVILPARLASIINSWMATTKPSEEACALYQTKKTGPRSTRQNVRSTTSRGDSSTRPPVSRRELILSRRAGRGMRLPTANSEAARRCQALPTRSGEDAGVGLAGNVGGINTTCAVWGPWKRGRIQWSTKGKIQSAARCARIRVSEDLGLERVSIFRRASFFVVEE